MLLWFGQVAKREDHFLVTVEEKPRLSLSKDFGFPCCRGVKSGQLTASLPVAFSRRFCLQTIQNFHLDHPNVASRPYRWGDNAASAHDNKSKALVLSYCRVVQATA